MGKGYRARDDDPVFYDVEGYDNWDDAAADFFTKELEALDSINSHGVEHWDAVINLYEFRDPELMARAAAEFSALPNTVVEARGNLLRVERSNPAGTRNEQSRIAADLSRRTEAHWEGISSWAWDLAFTATGGKDE